MTRHAMRPLVNFILLFVFKVVTVTALCVLVILYRRFAQFTFHEMFVLDRSNKMMKIMICY